MHLLAETKRVLQQIEELSGRQVQFAEDRSLSVLTTVVTARNGAPFHVIRYQPSDEPLDYRITYQAAYTLRLFQRPRDKRLDLVQVDEVAVSQATQLVSTGLDLNPREEELLLPFSRAVVHWVLMRLISLPVGLRIDAWIRRSFPTLHSQQEAGLADEQRLSLRGVSQSLERFTVPRHFAATGAAHALFADRLLGREWFAIPYRAMGLLDDGRALLALNDELPPEPEYDPELIDRWAEHLGIRSWYRWVPYQP